MKTTALVSLFTLTCWGQMANGDRGIECSLTIKVVDAQGNQRPYEVESFKPVGGGGELAQYFHGMTILGLGCGDYVVKLKPMDATWRGQGITACRDAESTRRVMVSGPRDAFSVVRAAEACKDAGVVYSRRLSRLRISLRSLEGQPSSY
jgi:hypothetical protein